MHVDGTAGCPRLSCPVATNSFPRAAVRFVPSRDTGVVMQGQLFVFSGCMVFQSNVLGHIKFKTMWAQHAIVPFARLWCLIAVNRAALYHVAQEIFATRWWLPF